MRIGIMDADLLGRKNHKFPNLACMKMSGYWKEQGAEVNMLGDYSIPKGYDHVYISKVFTDTPVPEWVERLKGTNKGNVSVGGTGFFFDKAPPLPSEIEHHMPDYSLYPEWFGKRDVSLWDDAGMTMGLDGKPISNEYTDYSIGFLTRGCFRKCPFCVNQKYDHVSAHSPLAEFVDGSRPKICLLDDNFLGYPRWRELLEGLIAMNKPFRFKQGLDERLLTEEKCMMLFNAKYDGSYTFAFDNIRDYNLIHSKLDMIRKYGEGKRCRFYVLTGFESTDENDIRDTFRRLELLFAYGCYPYIMRYMDKDSTPWKESRFRGMYIALAMWGNQPRIMRNMTFREFCEADDTTRQNRKAHANAYKSMVAFEKEFPDISKQYFDMKFCDPIKDSKGATDDGQ